MDKNSSKSKIGHNRLVFMKTQNKSGFASRDCSDRMNVIDDFLEKRKSSKKL